MPNIQLPDETLVPVYEAAPAGTDLAPTLLVIPTIFGVDEGTREICDAIAESGVLVWTFGPFFRTDPGPTGLHKEGVQRALARAKSHNMLQGLADVTSLLAALREHPRSNGRSGAVGICFGGKYAIMAAAAQQVDAAASWHGAGLGRLLGRFSKIEVPLAIHFASHDPLVPFREVEAVRAAVRDPTAVVIHQGTEHGFSHPGHPAYDASVARGCWLEIAKLLVN